MKKIRKRQRSDSMQNEPRKMKSGVGRWVYLGFLGVFAIGLGNHVWGDHLFLRADGLVLRERTIVAATSVVRVEDIKVRQGQAVSSGDVLLKVGSIDVLERIAEFATRNAELKERQAALVSREKQISELLPLAKVRFATTLVKAEELEKLHKKAVVSSQRFDAASEAAYNARVEYVRLKAEQEGLKLEVAAVSNALQQSSRALADLEEHYAEGVVRAAKNGRIGEMVPSAGAVYRPGDPMMSVISGDAYVLAYLPSSYLFGLKEGSKVDVANGRLNAEGYIKEILPVSQTVPEEFQNAFKPDQTHQLVRVQFTSPPPFPTSANVRVTLPFFGGSVDDTVLADTPAPFATGKFAGCDSEVCG
ncbi:MAG: HlyD family efflux transporter periplasmic adaptor subunit [Pseudomonadota bacterium]